LTFLLYNYRLNFNSLSEVTHSISNNTKERTLTRLNTDTLSYEDSKGSYVNIALEVGVCFKLLSWHQDTRYIQHTTSSAL